MRKQGLLKTQDSFVSLGSSNYESEQEQMNENWIYEDEPPSKKKKKKEKKEDRRSPDEAPIPKKG